MLKSPTTNRLEIMKSIKASILDGRLLPGAAMPTERELCERFATQRLTVRRALASLEEEGVVKRIGHRTRVVAERLSNMDNSVVLINSAFHHTFQVKHMAGWAAKMSEGVMAEVAQCHLNLLLIHPERLTDIDLAKMIAGRPFGVIYPEHTFGFTNLAQWFSTLKQAGIPVAVYGDNPEFVSYDRVVSDHEAGSYQLTKHFLGLGCKNPLLFYEINQENYWSKARYAGYLRAMQEANLVPLPMLSFPRIQFQLPPDIVNPTNEVIFDAKRRYAQSFLQDYLTGPHAGRKVDAIMVVSDGQLFETAAACRALGLKPGEDVLLGGYDNYWNECWEYQYEPFVPTATVDKGNIEMGRMLVHLTRNRAQGKVVRDLQRHVMTPQLVVVKNAGAESGAIRERSGTAIVT